ncbi:MAG: DUF5010 C-terminal domain-containing protein [Bacteroidota bacterium]|nr:DUF5010 C-terminal domain-containing protein [Bacteroidota bacterium]
MAVAQRPFVHPGIGYTQADIDRMKAMVAARQEPFYTSFQQLKSDTYSSMGRTARTWAGMTDKEGHPIITSTNNTIGIDGRCATQYALIWKITGDKTYADKAISFLNAYKNVRNSPSSGTAPLGNGQIYLLCEAAELMRDYEGWAPADQQAFKNMLVYPGYSSKVDMTKAICPETGYPYSHWDSEHGDTLNRVTFYWNIYNGDPGRHGNQGMFALRGLMAMGIYLDNDTIYDRALRKFLSLPHHSYDLPYPSGPPVQGSRNSGNSTQWFDYFNINSASGTGSVEDYGYDDELKYYIYENGQMEESSRDQCHAVCGIVMAEDIAHMAWSQGNDVYTQYNDRLLKGINWTWKYNYSWYNNEIAHQLYWQDEATWEPTVENGDFEIHTDRTGRWRSLKVNPCWENQSVNSATGQKYWSWSRGEKAQLQTQMLMHYKVCQGLSPDSLLWMQRAYDIMIDSLGYERGYKDTGHFYEFLGWGGLLDYRTVWMAGDGGRFEERRFVPGLPALPATIKAVDYDFYNNSVSGDGHTYHNADIRTDSNYRPEGGLEIAEGNGGYVLTGMQDGEWMNYTVTNATKAIYQVSVTAIVSGEGTSMGMAVDNGTEVTKALTATTGYETRTLGQLRIPAGASVLRLYIHGKGNQVQLSDIRLTVAAADTNVPDYVWNSRDYTSVSGSGSLLTDQSDKQLTSLTYSGTTSATFALSMSSVAYKVKTGQVYLVIHGKNLDHALLRNVTYRLTDGNSDITGSSIGGQASTWTYTGLGKDKDETILVWKADSSSSSRIVPLLKACYTGGYDDYTLKGLSFLAYGASQHKNTEIDDINFYTFDEMLAVYPELIGLPLAITQARVDKQLSRNGAVYNLNGHLVRTLKAGESRESVLRNLPKKHVYIVDREKIMND